MLKFLFCISILSMRTVISQGTADNSQNSSSSVPPSQVKVKNGTFPKDFIIGVSTSAFQTEGAWNENGKGESIWDRALHNSHTKTPDGQNIDIAADAYHLYDDDIKLVKGLGVNFYRFSVSWSRILPTGLINSVNQEGIEHYNRIINSLKDGGIEPMIVMTHYDLPQGLQDLGGWANPFVADYFEQYARLLYKQYGDRVKYWITINDPYFVSLGYSNVTIPPGLNATSAGTYSAVYTLLLAHAKAYRRYDDEFRSTQQGKIGISLSGRWYEPQTNLTDDVTTAEMMMQMELGIFAQPICGPTGDYPSIVKEQVNKTSIAEGFNISSLRGLTPTEISQVQRTFDFLGVNYYTTMLVRKAVPPTNGSDNLNITRTDVSNWKLSADPEQPVVPWGLRKLLNWIKKAYNNPRVIITENGYSDKGQINDTDRIYFIVDHINETMKAVNEDGCNVTGYTYWSLIDGFEWGMGYTVKYGLYQVNFSDPHRNRTAKSSAYVFASIVQNRTLECNHTVTQNGTVVPGSAAANTSSASHMGHFFSYNESYLLLCLASVIYTSYITRP